MSVSQKYNPPYFWETQNYFEKMIPRLRDNARTRSHMGVITLYITRRQPTDVITMLHDMFLTRMVPNVAKNHVLFDTPFERVLYDKLWENQTPPVGTQKEALRSLVMWQSELKISKDLIALFIQRLLDANEFDLAMSCILSPGQYMSYSLESNMSNCISHTESFLEKRTNQRLSKE